MRMISTSIRIRIVVTSSGLIGFISLDGAVYFEGVVEIAGGWAGWSGGCGTDYLGEGYGVGVGSVGYAIVGDF